MNVAIPVSNLYMSIRKFIFLEVIRPTFCARLLLCLNLFDHETSAKPQHSLSISIFHFFRHFLSTIIISPQKISLWQKAFCSTSAHRDGPNIFYLISFCYHVPLNYLQGLLALLLMLITTIQTFFSIVHMLVLYSVSLILAGPRQGSMNMIEKQSYGNTQWS